jgi:hypothetical protein
MDTAAPTKEGISLDSLSSFVKKLADSLTKEGLDYAFTGAIAASFYGIPRTTADIDILVNLSEKNAKVKLASALRSAGLEIEEKRIDDALTSGYSIATFHSKTSPHKVDIIISGRIQKRNGNIAGVDTFLQTPEDLLAAKLRMIKATAQEERALKDEEDVKAILRFTKVDKNAVRKQAQNDKTLEIWNRLLGN